MRRSLILCGMALCLVSGTAQATILVNGGFEDGDTGPISDPIPGWSSWGGSGWHHDDDGRVIDTKAIKFWWDGSGVWQDFTAVPGQEYDFSVQALNSPLEQMVHWNGLIKAEFYDSSVGTGPGQALLELELDRYFSDTDPIDEWVQIGGTATAPPNADVGRIVLLMVDWADGAAGSVNFDNAVVTPEPASLALVVLGGAALLRRRRA